MTFAHLQSGSAIFLDANILVYHLTAQRRFGTNCTALVKRVEQQDIAGFTSTHILTEIAHRVMLIEASTTFARPLPGMLKYLRQHPDEVQKLVQFRLALEQVLQTGIQVLTIAPSLLVPATIVSQQTGLLSNDALLVAVMQANALTNLASHDTDFDRVPGITRYEPA